MKEYKKDKRITDICKESGFSSFAEFAHIVKKKYGYSPRKLRTIKV